MKLRELIFLVFLWLFSLVPFKGHSQKVYYLGASYSHGLNLNRVGDREFGKSIPSGFDLYFHRQREGNKYWEKLFNYPQTGWSLNWIDHRNKLLGHTFALNRYMNYVFWKGHSFEVYLKLSQGIMYATKFYEAGSRSNEHFNNAISQSVNFSEELGLGLNIFPAKHFGINLAATLVHFSNGAISQPNDGLNLLMFRIGAVYIIGEKENIEFKIQEVEEDDRSVRYNITAGCGIKQFSPENEEKFQLTTISFYADKKLSRVNAVNVGFDIFMNKAVQYAIENDSEYKGKDFRRIGVSAGHEFFIHRIGILTQVGYHIYSPYPAISSFYQKFGLKYYITDLLFVTFTDRIFEFTISDEVTWGIGVRL
jgi:hypothetical protein